MISSNDLRPGITIEYKDEIWQVIEAMHVKPGKGAAFVQSKLKNVKTRSVLSVNFRAGEKLRKANINRAEFVFLYREGLRCVMLNNAGTESIEIDSIEFGENIDLLKEGQTGITVMLYRGLVLRAELPNNIDLIVKETPADQRGDTTCGAGKKAMLETGAILTVPFHINIGDKIRVDSRNRQYNGRIND